MPKSDDQEFWELLNRIDAEAAQAPEAQGGEGFGHGPDFPDGEKPMLYKNYSNGYGRDIRNYSNGYGQGQAQPQSQPHAQPIRAYNADFRSTGERVRVNHGDYPPRLPKAGRPRPASLPPPGKSAARAMAVLQAYWFC